MYVSRCCEIKGEKCDQERSRKDSETYRPYNINPAHVECKKQKWMPVTIGAIGSTPQSFRKYLRNIPGKHEVKELQQSAVLGTAHILRAVLM